jgi:hypothetical protein
MKKGMLYILPIFIFFNSCTPYNPLSQKNNFEYEKVERCRNDWTFSNLHDTLEISLLIQDKKGNYDMVSWPNLFIGINPTGDTLGIVDYDCEKIFRKRDIIRFLPSNRDTSILAVLDSRWDEPVFRVSKKSKENDLYCSVKIIYFGKVFEK